VSRRGRAVLAAALLGAVAGGCSPRGVEIAGILPEGLLTGLVGHWTFDEGSGMTVHDSSGNGRDGTIAGNGWSWVSGKFGGALSFGGPDLLGTGGDQVTVGQFPQATASFTVSAWLQFPAPDGGPTMPPTGTLVSTETQGGGWSLYLSLPTPTLPNPMNYDLLYPLPTPNQYVYAYCTSCLIPDAWVHIAAVVDGGGGTATLYVNGALARQVPAAHAISPTLPTLYFGRWSGMGRYLIGALDDVAIWNRALVQEEIGLLEQAPVPAPM